VTVPKHNRLLEFVLSRGTIGLFLPSIAVDDAENRHKRLYKRSTTLVGFQLLAFCKSGVCATDIRVNAQQHNAARTKWL
jgi:hypothetical protein